MLNNLHKLVLLLPIQGANNIIMDSQVINSIFLLTTFREVMSVINPTYNIRNFLVNKTTTTQHTKEPKNNVAWGSSDQTT